MKAVLFDLDNTLLRKRPTVPEQFCRILRENGIAVGMEAAQRAYAACELWTGNQIQRENATGIRMSDEEFLQNLMRRCAEFMPIGMEEAALLEPVWMGGTRQVYETADDAIPVLEALAAQDLLLGVVSNNVPEVRNTMDELGLTKYFQTIVISQEVGLYKPDPKILLLACDRLGVSAKEAMYVGDHPFDVLCANAAGMAAAWIPFNEYMSLVDGIPEPEYRLRVLSELPGILHESFLQRSPLAKTQE